MKIRTIIISILFLMVMGGCASATTHISGGVVNSYNLNTLGETYLLDGDVTADSTAFSAGANNITLDGQGHNVTYALVSTGSGLIDTARNNIVVKNINFIKNNTGVISTTAIKFVTCTNCTAQNFTATSNAADYSVMLSSANGNFIKDFIGLTSGAGIDVFLTSSSNNSVSNGIITCATGQGAYISQGNSNIINNITANATSGNPLQISQGYGNALNRCNGYSSSSGYGATIQNSYLNNINYCNFSSVSSNGLYLSNATNNSVDHSNMSANTSHATYLTSNSNYNTLSNNTHVSVSGNGMYIFSSGNNIINDSVCNSTTNSGIYSVGSSYNSIILDVFNSISGNGIYLNTLSNYNNIKNCISNSISGHGAYIVNSVFNTITSTTSNSSSGNGIYLINASNNNTLINNTAYSNTGMGLELYSANGTTVNGNHCESYNRKAGSSIDAGYGLFIWNSTSCEVTNCTIKSTMFRAIYISIFSNYSIFSNNIIISPIMNCPITNKKHILSIGDSITFGPSDVSTIGGYVTYMNDTLNKNTQNFICSNQGVGGDTALNVKDRINEELQLFQPDIVTLEIGTNDISQGRAQQDIINDVLTICNEISASGAIPIVLLTPATRNATTDRIYLDRNLSTQLNASGIKNFNVYDLIDSTPLNGIYDAYNDSNYYIDGVHPNDAADQIIGTWLAHQILITYGCNFSGTPLSGVSPLSVHFADISKNSTSWSWDFNNDGIIDSTQQNPIHTYGKAGNYSVNLTVTNEYGTFSTVKTNYINVTAQPAPSTISEFWSWIKGYFGWLLPFREAL